jgi:alpha-1,3-rhamnosyl/mannosyltransferase
MRIGINGRHLGPGKTGVGRYLQNLLRVWGQEAHGHEFLVYYSSENPTAEDRALLAQPTIQARRVPRPLGSYHLWHNVALPRALVRDRVDCFFSPDYFCPVVLPRHLPRCLTIHDVSYIVHPEWYSWQYRVYCTVNSVWPARRADLIFTISEFQRDSIIRATGVASPQIRVTPLAADPSFHPAPDRSSLTLPPGVSGPYFLFVGMIFNRRHIVESLNAFEQFVQRTGNNQFQFVIRGSDATRPAQGIAQRAAAINRRLDRTAVVLLPHLPDAALTALYQASTAFLYPSSYEGFGLPVLEAMACGIPTITVRASAIPEVAGDAAIYVDPLDVGGLSRILERVVSDDTWVQELRRLSLAQASRFSWKRTAHDTLKAIESVA